MKIQLQQLQAYLTKQSSHLYLISGDEPLLRQEALECIKHSLSTHEYMRFQCNAAFKWEILTQALSTISLFNPSKLVHLDLNALPSSTGRTRLLEHITTPPHQVTLVITMQRLAPKMQQTKWVKHAIESALWIPVWPLDAHSLSLWLRAKLTKAQLSLTDQALEQLALYTEGNLLAANQALEKLRLRFDPNTTVDADTITAFMTHNAQYDVFKLQDALLLGNSARVLHILNTLQAEGDEAIHILWALHRQLTTLLTLQDKLNQDTPTWQAYQACGVWQKQQPLVNQALSRLKRPYLKHFLAATTHIDQMIKGIRPGKPWEALTKLALAICGTPLKMAL